jgi:ATP-dependent RNA helicase DeaD
MIRKQEPAVVDVESADTETFSGLGLSEALTQTLSELGYEAPTPIQSQTIPHLLAGRDLIGQAQTGTGKTAAFALPILDRLDLQKNTVQALILAPTRELAIQVSEAVHSYAKRLGRVKVMPIYGGDSIMKQITRLKGGMNVVVGTPGRVMDHLRRGTLDFKALRMVVLDEADEMLRMGFLEDVEWILKQAPEGRQTALFSATMPREVRLIAERYLRNPVPVEVRHRTLTVPTVEQVYIHVAERQKLDALTHMLETGAVAGESILIFSRTKIGAADVSEKLQARGYAAEAMHGDMNQAQRESVIRRMRGGTVEIVVATDVAARGLDVENIGQVINYDMPNDPESYVHRIGRTARAGRTGKTILFVTPRDNRMLREIERFTGQRLTPAKVPTRADVAARRMNLFKERILKTVREEELETYLTLVEELAEESGCDMTEIAAAAARLASGDKPLSVPIEPEPSQVPRTDEGMVRLFIYAGRSTGVRPSDVVGAIANEAGVPGNAIGAIDIYDDFTFVDIPAQYKDQVLTGMSGATIRNRETNIRLATEQDLLQERPRGRRGAGPGGPRGPGGPGGGRSFGDKSRKPAGPFWKKKDGKGNFSKTAKGKKTGR